MIFVSVGTHEAPFDRLLEAVYGLELDEELIVQYGPSAVRCERAEQVEYLPFEQVLEHIRSARAVVMHAGVGSVMISLANGKRPIVMARRRQFGEHVDDHQVELARRMEANGLVTVADDGDSLADALAQAAEPPGRIEDVPWLGTDLRSYLSDQLGEPAQASPVGLPA